MKDHLSPAAQAIRSAYHEICENYDEQWLNFNHNRGLAAVLRAVADHLTFDDSLAGPVINPHELLDIAAELERQHDGTGNPISEVSHSC